MGAPRTGLGSLDPRQVPLPHGTLVATRRVLVLGERSIPEGALGRVTGGDGHTVEVRLVSGEHLTCARADLLARKVGQLRWAQARAASWAQLSPGIVLTTTVGSRAWGLEHGASDTDRRGIFALPFSHTLGLVDPPLDLSSEDGSSTYWEVKKAFLQALRADPNTLEALFVPGASPQDPIGEWILEGRGCFVSAQIYGSFGRYALSQLKKLEQAQRLAEHREVVLTWLRDEPDLTLDLTALRLAQALKLGADADAQHRAKEHLKHLCRSLHDQGLLPDRAFPSLARLAAEPIAFRLPRELRPKNAYNLLRLLHTAILWLRTGEPIFRLGPPVQDRLRAIKEGQVPLVEVLAEAEGVVPLLEEAWRQTKLPPGPDWLGADRLLQKIQLELARRYVAQEPGHFGAAAPPPPEPNLEREWAEEGEDDGPGAD